MWELFAMLFAVTGLIFLIIVALKPKLFWPVLVVASVGAAGLSVKGSTIIDEYLIGCVLLGWLISVSIGITHLYNKKESLLDFTHKWAFYFLIIYLIIQSFRGIILFEDPGKFRWVVFYAIIGIIAFIMSHSNFSDINKRKLSFIISCTTSVYLIMYLFHGLFTEIVRGISRYSVQPGEWSTTAYALFPLVVGMPAAMFLLRDKIKKYRYVGVITLTLAVFAALYYDSRTSWLVIIVFFSSAFFNSNYRKYFVAVFSLIVVIVFSLGISGAGEFNKKTERFSEDLSRATKAVYFWDITSKTDIDRKAYIKVGFVSIMQDWKSFFFGYGFRMHGEVIGPYLREIYNDAGFPEHAEKIKDNVATEGFTAFLVDTGAVGLFLLLINFLLVAIRIIIQKNNSNRIILLLSLTFTFLWLPVINMLDIMLFYLLIMPKGFLTQLSASTINIINQKDLIHDRNVY